MCWEQPNKLFQEWYHLFSDPELCDSGDFHPRSPILDLSRVLGEAQHLESRQHEQSCFLVSDKLYPEVVSCREYLLLFGGSDGRESACSAGDLGSIPGSGRSPGGGDGNPLQYSCLENPMGRGAWQATVHGVTKSWTRLSNFIFFLSPVKGDACHTFNQDLGDSAPLNCSLIILQIQQFFLLLSTNIMLRFLMLMRMNF